MSGLLNPPITASVCKEMIQHVQNTLDRCEYNLTHSVLDREAYLIQIGQATALRSAKTDLEQIYQRNFAV